MSPCHSRVNRLSYLAASLIACCLAPASAAPPASPVVPEQLAPRIEIVQPGVRLTLLAENPLLATPTGIDVDTKGNLWLIACHTHFRPQDYAGPKHDEVLVFTPDGRSRRVFYNRTDATMQLKLGPDGWVYLAERDRILRVRDSDGDGRGDVEENLATLDTSADYPHNGLAGLAWHPSGDLLFSLGDNMAKEWTLTARDGIRLSGSGEGGIFRCRADGSGLRRIARGFWNPFGILVRGDGEMFAADNDPGNRPPCRLLNVVEGGDYGYQRTYGDAPVHPFVAWNGELRGTLGMVYPCGEGPCAVMDLGGGVLIPSWSNHRLDYFPLVRQGAGYTSRRIELLHGSDFFRPVCLARGADGAFYLTDWVFSSYALHGRGRLWKLEIDRQQADWVAPGPEPLNEAARLAKELREGHASLGPARLFELARGKDPYLSDAALTALARQSADWSPEFVRGLAAQERVWALVALRRVNLQDERWVRLLFADPDPEVRFECLRWISDAALGSFRGDVEQLLTRNDLDYRLFEAVIATTNALRGKPEAGITDVDVLVERVASAATPARLKGYALRLLPPTHPKISLAMLRELLAAGDPELSLEVVRTLAGRDADADREILAEIAADRQRGQALRAEAIAGLAASGKLEHHRLLLALADDDEAGVRDEALRGLRLASLDAGQRESLRDLARRHPDASDLVQAALDPAAMNANRPALDDTAAWLRRLTALPGKADPAAGRRVFYHPRVALCATCHRRGGRGNVVGPDLTLVARQGDAAAILRSILEPSRDIAPQFQHTILQLADGTVFSGILLRSSHVDIFRDVTGKERTFRPEDIEQRTEAKTSLMPVGLVSTLTDRELRDLLAFLLSAADSADSLPTRAVTPAP